MAQMCLDTHGTQRGEAPSGKERGGEPSGEGHREKVAVGGHRVEGLCRGSSGAASGHRGKGRRWGHGGEGRRWGHGGGGRRRREQGATWWHHDPSRHCPSEGGIVHWKQEDKELSLSQGSFEKEEVPGGSLERSEVTQ